MRRELLGIFELLYFGVAFALVSVSARCEFLEHLIKTPYRISVSF
jgi:hypothetical protein